MKSETHLHRETTKVPGKRLREVTSDLDIRDRVVCIESPYPPACVLFRPVQTYGVYEQTNVDPPRSRRVPGRPGATNVSIYEPEIH